jgi:hypothetical protein
VVINVCFFRNHLDIAVLFSNIFHPFPHVALMLVFTAVSYISKVQKLSLMLHNQIECSIDEWGTGAQINIHFTTDAYQSVFEEHLCVFNNFVDYCRENGCPNLVQKLLEHIHDHGW